LRTSACKPLAISISSETYVYRLNMDESMMLSSAARASPNAEQRREPEERELSWVHMPHYFFDTRDGADFIRDEIGLELDGFEAARDEATRGLADFAKDAIPGAVRRELAVEVRDELHKAIVRAGLWFEVAVLAG
jgi:hypothetical protein